MLTFLETRQIGRIIASLTHELRNNLNVVRTSMGLAQDICKMGKKGLKHADKMEKGLDKIDAHSKRAVESLNQANWFGHAMDHETRSYKVAEMAASVAHLMERLAGQSETVLKTEFTGADPKAEGPAIRVFLAASMMVDACLEKTSPGAELALVPVEEGGRPGVKCVFRKGGDKASAESLAQALPLGFDQVLAQIGAEVKGLDDGPGLLLLF